jgi:hypothetical protein
MYSHRELSRLAAHKSVLGARIARHRAECVAASAELLRPLVWCDSALSVWRRFSGLLQVAALPVAMMAGRTLFRRANVLGRVLRWAPVALGLWRAVRARRS